MVKVKKIQTDEIFSIDDIAIEINKSPNGPTPKKTPYITHKSDDINLKTILLGVRDKRHVLLKGPTGCGKTATIRHLAYVTNNPYRRMQLTGATGVDSFVGRYILTDKGTEWRDGILLEAMKKGQWLILDELNMALPEITAVLNAIMDDDYQLVVDEHEHETVQPHENFRIFACINPSDEYAGTKELNRALLDRFDIVIDVPYSNAKKLKEMIEAHAGLDDTFGAVDGRQSILSRMIEFCMTIREQYEDQKLAFNCSDRQVLQWAKLVKSLGVKSAAKVTILGKAEKEEIEKITDQLNKLFMNDEDVSYDTFMKNVRDSEEEKMNKELEEARRIANLQSRIDHSQTTTASTSIPEDEIPF